MKEYWKEIVICVIALATAGLAVWFFYRSLETEKEVSQINLYNAIPADSDVILQINRTPSFYRISGQLFPAGKPVADIFPALLQNIPESSHSLLSFHPQGELLYTSISDKQRKKIENTVAEEWFPLYSPQSYDKYGFRFIYYPDTAGHFFGYFYGEGLWIAGYSRKLLEEAAKQYTNKKSQRDIPSNTVQTNSKFPVNLYFRNTLLLPDSLSNKTGNWQETEILISEGHFCISTLFPNEIFTLQEKDSIAAIITENFKNLIPSLSNEYQLSADREGYNYTICAPIQ